MMQNTPPIMPDNFAYYHAAYVAVALVYGGYAASLWLRTRRVREGLRQAEAEAVDRAEAPPIIVDGR